MKLKFSSKARTLKKIKLRNAKILPMYIFCEGDYKKSKKKIIDKIYKKFDKKIIIRSSANDEDQFKNSSW